MEERVATSKRQVVTTKDYENVVIRGVGNYSKKYGKINFLPELITYEKNLLPDPVMNVMIGLKHY
jgi:hypothetical protein